MAEDLTRAIANARKKFLPAVSEGFAEGAQNSTPGVDWEYGPPPADNSIFGNTVKAVGNAANTALTMANPVSAIRTVAGTVMPNPADVARTVTGALSQYGDPRADASTTLAAPRLAQAATPVVPQRADVTALLNTPSSGSIPGLSEGAAATKPFDPADQFKTVTAPTLKAPGPLPRMNFNVGEGQNVGGGVFGALARNVNSVADYGDQVVGRKVLSKGFADQVTAATTNVKNSTDVFDSRTKRMGVEATAAAAQAKNTIESIKAGKSVQEAELLKTHRALLAEYAKNPSSELADMIALVKGHVLPDKIISFPESVINQSAPSAVSVRHGTSITPKKGGGGFSVEAINNNTASPTDKVYMNSQGQKVRIVNGQQVPI